MLKITLLVLVVVVIIFVVPRLFSGSRAAPPGPGVLAPDFTLSSQEGASVSLRDYRGKWVILLFLPQRPDSWLYARSPQFSSRSIQV